MDADGRTGSGPGALAWLPVAIAGALLVCIAAYTQWVSMDLDTYGPTSYLRQDLASVDWWRSVGAPFVMGVVLVSSALWLRSCSALPRIVLSLTFCAILLSLFSRVVMLAAMILSLVTVIHYYRNAR